MRLLLLLFVSFSVLFTGCSDSASPDAGPASTATAPLGSLSTWPPQSTASSDDERQPPFGHLEAVPSTGGCAPFSIRGDAFPPGQDISVLKYVSLDEVIDVVSARADDQGSFAVIVASEALGSCQPGSEHLFAARPRWGEPLGNWAKTVYTVTPPGSLTVEPERPRCDEAIRVRGTGFPPTATVTISVGEASVFANPLAPLGRIMATSNGEIDFTYKPPPTSKGCKGKFAIYALVNNSDSRWKVVFVYAE